MLALSLSLAAAALALQGAEPDIGQSTGPCDAVEALQAFNFWVGEWNVYDGDGVYQGHNRISKTDGGCLIREEWTSANGNTGFSMNFRDHALDAWRQIWVSPGLQLDYSGGLNEAGEMVLEGEVVYPAQGLTAPFRGVWTPLEDGRVRQHFTQANAETGAWEDWFIGYYVRVEDDPNAAEHASPGG
ncbi:MAG: hypothetical protein AAFX09_03305 [Pseudomonadota bacterium]